MINHKVVAIIPARGGSKRILNKNIKLFAGQPVISYSIRVAQETGLFDRIIVSTDSLEIADMARSYGAEVPFLRPAELANDFAGTAEVVCHAIEWLARDGMQPEFICCIYATAPFIQANYLKQGYEKLINSDATTVFSVTTYPYPIYRSLKITENGRITMIWPDYKNFRSQDLSEAYHDAGQFYWANTNKFMKGKALFAEDSLPVILPRYLVQDIDTPEDWETAEMMFATMNAKTDCENK
ncbi:MAG: pseudaminic acid cytidylyltransferase [Syntrophales bacterium]